MIGVLPGANEAVMPVEKFTMYALNPSRQADKAVGENGKTAKVLTGWIDDAETGQMRLTSVYVNK